MHLIMFDIDGTLIDTNHIEATYFTQAIKEFLNVETITHNWLSYKNVTNEGIAREFIEDHFNRAPIKLEVDNIKNSFLNKLQNELFNHKPFNHIKGAQNTINLLKENDDYAIAIATGSYLESALLKLEKAQFYIDDISIATCNDSYKRNVIMQTALQRAKSQYQVKKFDSITYVGDGPWDLQAANLLGYNFIGINSNFPLFDLTKAGAKWVLNDFQDYNKFISIINRFATNS